MAAQSVVMLPLSLLLVVIGSAVAQLQGAIGPESSLLENLRSIGAIQNPENPCIGIRCANGRFCAVVNLGSSSIRTYQCRRAVTTPPPLLPTVPQCYDKVEIRVPATNSFIREAFVMPAQPACRNECVTDWSCDSLRSGRICCMQGCDRICHSPKTTVVDYTKTSPPRFGTLWE